MSKNNTAEGRVFVETENGKPIAAPREYHPGDHRLSDEEAWYRFAGNQVTQQGRKTS